MWGIANARDGAIVEKWLERVGIKIDGPDPSDIQVHDRRLFRRLLAEGLLGAGESYMDGWWDCPRLDDLFCRIARSQAANRETNAAWRSYPIRDGRADADQFANPRSVHRGREVALQPGEFTLPVHARSLHAVFLRLFPQYGGSGDSPTPEARSDLPQATARKVGPAAGYRLRLGRAGQIRGRKIWLPSCRRQYLRRPDRIRRARRARDCQSKFSSSTTAIFRESSTRSPRSACSSMSATRIIGNSWMSPSAF